MPAFVEIRVGDSFPRDTTPAVKYHLADHLGSSNQVIDIDGKRINREEYTPYGETSFGSYARKRYRFTGKERDEESGLYYHGARYYGPWLGRWVSPDPLGIHSPEEAGHNLFAYVRGKVLVLVDPAGLTDSDQSSEGTIVIAYGSGWINPEDLSHGNQEGAFRLAAEAKRRELVSALGKEANQYEIVLLHTPTDKELIEALNRDYRAPITEFHLFSHGFSSGINLGGRQGKDDVAARHFIQEDFEKLHPRWASDATVTFYGCNVGRTGRSDAFAQTFSDTYGVHVRASNTSTHFERGSYGLAQKPDTGGRVLDFYPSSDAIAERLQSAEGQRQRYEKWMAKHNSKRVGLITSMHARSEAVRFARYLKPNIRWLQRVMNSPSYKSANGAEFSRRIMTLTAGFGE